MALKKSDQIQGTCYEFCPERERKERQRQRRVHLLERRQPKKSSSQRMEKDFLMIKEYSRPAAGKDATDRRDLRPPSILLEVVEYMMTDLATRDDLPWSEVYLFVFDRLRAIRQDLVIQRASCKESVRILECAVRFHIYAGYRLCEESLSKFEPKFNSDHCQECLKRLLVEYREDGFDSNNRAEFEALYILYNLGSFEVLQTSLQLPSTLRNHQRVKLAYDISTTFLEGNFVRLRKLVQQCDFLQRCAIHRHLPLIRRDSLAIVNSGFYSKNIKFPVEVLAKWLFFDSTKEACGFCVLNGFVTTTDGIQFKREVPQLKPNLWPDKKSHQLVQRHFEAMSAPDVILGNQRNEQLPQR
ncbi:SAC3 domain-containing protein 1-like [Apostichopus japonicus]|uniref:SAC3 domain-containing protein 1-like n=1 Tax=Stichopus japonicus TaxID=307972 RepID=UPI003AB451A6